MIKIKSYLQYQDVNNFEWIEDTFQFNKDFRKKYNEESDKEYFLEINVQDFERLHEIHNDLPFLLEKMEIEKVEKLVSTLHEKKTEYVIRIRNLKLVLNHALIVRRLHRVIKFNQNPWLKTIYWYEHKSKKKTQKNKG